MGGRRRPLSSARRVAARGRVTAPSVRPARSTPGVAPQQATPTRSTPWPPRPPRLWSLPRGWLSRTPSVVPAEPVNTSTSCSRQSLISMHRPDWFRGRSGPEPLRLPTAVDAGLRRADRDAAGWVDHVPVSMRSGTSRRGTSASSRVAYVRSTRSYRSGVWDDSTVITIA